MTQTIRHLTWLGCAVLLLLAAAPTSAQVPDEFTNLKVLNKEIGKQQLIGIMRGWAGALGVRCNHCHVGPDNLQGMDFASDEKEHKRAARSMLEMAIAINNEHIGSWEEEGDEGEHQRVNCFTCHRGQPEPPRKLTSILNETVGSEGVDAAMAQYKEMKDEYYGAGVYDFRERIFGELAQDAAEAGKIDAALQVLRSALEIYPESADLHAFLGMALIQSGDAAGAAGVLEKALELDPDNASAKRGKAMLERTQK